MRASRWIGLGLFAAAVILAGDRLSLSRSHPGVLRFAHTFTTASERAIIDDAVEEFEARHPGLEVRQIVSNSETYNTVGWRLQFRGRKQPDVFFHWQGYKVDESIDRGWALDLTPYLSDGFLDQFVASSVDVREGKVYFLPQSIDLCNLVWHNADLFRELGLAEPATFEAWAALCGELRKAGRLPLGQGNRDLWPMGNFAAELMAQSLGAAASKRLFEPRTDVTSESLNGLRALDRLNQIGAFDLPGALEEGAIGTLGDIDAKVLFLTGRSAQHIVGSWFVADIQDARERGELDFEVGVFPPPSRAGEPDVLAAVTTGFLVNPAAKNPAAATEFLELILSRRYQERFAALGTLSARRDAAEFTTEPLSKELLGILRQTEETVPPPDTGYPPPQAQLFYELTAKLLTGRVPMEEAADYWSSGKRDLARKGL